MSQTKQRVFVVDDEPVIAMTMVAILCLHEYAARSFTDPLKALETFRHECADVLLSDVMMPGLTGVDLAMQVRSLCPECRVLLISGNAATCDLLSSARLNGHDFQLLAKPVFPLRVIETIQQSFHPAA